MRRISVLVTLVIIVLTALVYPQLANAERTTPQSGAALTLLQQPVSLKNPLAYIGKDGNVYLTGDTSGTAVPLTGDSAAGPTDQSPFYSHTLAYGQFAWSPDGTMLAFTERTQNRVFLVTNGGKAAQVATSDSGFPASFSPDGKELAYVVKTGQQAGADNADLILQIQGVPTTGGSPHALGSLEGKPWVCGADLGPDPGEMVYFNEIGLIGSSPMIFAWIKQGYLHTMSCTGRGLALSGGANDIWENPALENAAVSPDQTKAVAVQLADANDPNSAKKLVIVDLATGNLTPLDTQAGVDRAIWSSDGQSIIYSAIAPVRSVTSDGTKSVGTQLFAGKWPFPGVQEYGVYLWTVPASGGQSTNIFKEAGRGVGYLTASHSKPAIAFSFATSTARMIDGINAGSALSQVLDLAPHPEVRIAPLDATGLPTTIGIGGQPSYGPATDFSVIPASPSAAPTLISPPTLVSAPTLILPPTATFVPLPTFTPIPPSATPAIVLSSGGICPGFLPSRLVIGGQGRVIAGGAPNRLRASPATGAILTNIPPGGVFDVLSGPVCTSNGIAWWQVRYSGTVGYTAEGQGTTYFVEPYSGPTPAPTLSGGTFGIVGVPAHVSPASASVCPSTFNFTGQIVVNTSGTVTYRWERSDGAEGPVQTLIYDPGVTTKDVATTWTLGAPGTYWQRIHVLTPNDVFSNQATFTLSCGAAPFTVVSVSSSVSSPGGAACPILYNFDGAITVLGAGTVSYRWERSDSASAPVQTLSFATSGTQHVTDSWQLGGPGSTINGWERVHILTPNDLTSNQANFVLNCP